MSQSYRRLEHIIRSEEEEENRIRKKALELLKSPMFFYELGKLLEKGWVLQRINRPRFVLGEEQNKRLLPLLILGVKKGYTGLIQLVGESGTGKDTMVRLSLDLLREAVKYIERGYITPASLRYSQNLRDVDLLYVPDIERMQGEMGRTLRLHRADDGGIISEYAYMDQRSQRMTTETVYMPIKGIITTTNVMNISPSLKSGMWRLETSSSPELTKKIMLEKLRLHEGKRSVLSPDSEELKVWRTAFKILVEEVNVDPKIPYAERLIDLFNTDRSESRRDPDKLCELIKIVAICRYFQKPEDKRDEADLTDLYIALRLGSRAIERTIFDLTEEEKFILKTVENVCDGQDGGVTVNEVLDLVGSFLGYSRRTVYEKLEGLVAKGYLHKERKGRENVYHPRVRVGGELSLTCNASLESVEGVVQYIRERFANLWNLHQDTIIIDPITGEEVRLTDRYVCSCQFHKIGIREERKTSRETKSGKLAMQDNESLGQVSMSDVIRRLTQYFGYRKCKIAESTFISILSDACGIDERTVDIVMRRLEEIGIIVRDEDSSLVIFRSNRG